MILVWGALISGIGALFVLFVLFVMHLYAGYSRMPVREKEKWVSALIQGILAEAGIERKHES